MLNKKGFTIAEVIISFTILSIILASVIGSTIFYRNKMKEEEILTQLADFKNTVTKVVYDDILANDNRRIVNVERCIGTANCINLIDKANQSHTLKIVEYTSTTTDHKRGIYLSYNNILYMLPDSDLGVGEERVCDFIRGFDIENYSQDNLGLYTIKTSFRHKDLDAKYDIMLTITRHD